MTSWPSPCKDLPVVWRDPPVSHGGLGGCVGLEQHDLSEQLGGLKGKRRPQPLKLTKHNGLLFPGSPHTMSADSSRTTISARSLLSPFFWRADGKKNNRTPSARMQTDGLQVSHSSISLSSDAELRSLATRVKSGQSPIHGLFELPGSLLLPSQGFPAPPETPAKLIRRTTNESDPISTPPLTTCNTISSEQSPTMGFWKAKTYEDGHHPYDSDAGEAAGMYEEKTEITQSTISKPFNLMSIDELLDALPTCGPEVLHELWSPELRKKVLAMKAVIQSAENRTLHSYERLVMMDNDLHSISVAAQNFPQLYKNVFSDAEELAEKEIKTFKKQIDEVEDAFDSLDEENQQLRAEANVRSKEATAAKYNAYAIVDSIRSVLEEALRHPHAWDRIQCQNMLQLLQDYPTGGEHPAFQALRLPQQIYKQLAADLREANDTTTAWRSIAGEQAQHIKDQSTRLTEDLKRYEEIAQTLRTRDHEVLLLASRNQELEDALQDHEALLQQAERDRARIQALQDQVDQVTKQYEDRVQGNDQALVEMREELDRAQRDLLTTQIDLRNARTSQAVAAGDGVNKPRPSLPSSYSSFALNVRQLTEQPEQPKPQQTYRILSPCGGLSQPHSAEMVSSQPQSSTGYTAPPAHARHLSDPFQDPAPSGGRPRAGSLDGEKVLTYRPNDGAKPLPTPPAISPRIPHDAVRRQSTVGLDANLSIFEDPRPAPLVPIRNEHGPETPASGKRILSIIAEASQEGSSSQESMSATSSEKDDYRNSISALEMLNIQSSPASNESESPTMHASWAEVHRRHDPRNTAARDLDVSKMYHKDRHHL